MNGLQFEWRATFFAHSKLLNNPVPIVVVDKAQKQLHPHLKEEEVLRNLLDQFFFYFFWEELSQETKGYRWVLGHFLIQDLHYQKHTQVWDKPTRWTGDCLSPGVLHFPAQHTLHSLREVCSPQCLFSSVNLCSWLDVVSGIWMDQMVASTCFVVHFLPSSIDKSMLAAFL